MHRIDAAGFAAGNLFTDGNPATGTPATVVDAAWLNDLQENVAQAIEATGIGLAKGNYTQLLTALRSAGLFTTPAQFDNSTKAATTAFVKQSGATLSNFYAFNASATLPPNCVGGIVEFYGATSGQTLTLPLASGARAADVLTLINYGSVPVTIARQGTEQINWGGGSGGTSLVLQPGDSLVLTAGAGWFVIGGSAANQFSGGFGTSLAGNGYQKLPSGLLVQWGSVTSSASADVAFTFPVAFTSSMLTGYATYQNTSTGSNSIVGALGAKSTTSVNVGAYSSNTATRVAAQVNVVVFGF